MQRVAARFRTIKRIAQGTATVLCSRGVIRCAGRVSITCSRTCPHPSQCLLLKIQATSSLPTMVASRPFTSTRHVALLERCITTEIRPNSDKLLIAQLEQPDTKSKTQTNQMKYKYAKQDPPEPPAPHNVTTHNTQPTIHNTNAQPIIDQTP